MGKMKLKLIIDVGNTLTKIALFKGQVMIRFKSIDRLTKNDLIEAITSFIDSGDGLEIQVAILSAVGKVPKDVMSFLSADFEFYELTHQTSSPIKNLYISPETLGLDRLAAVIGASQYYSNEDLLVIDCGTCITYDFLTSEKEYLGGGISPGIDLRFKALNTFTANLPLVNRSGHFDLIGKTTDDAIRSGVLNGVLNELNGTISNYKGNYPELKVLLTGGDVKFFDGKLKSDIFANSNLVLEGLNLILDYNIDE